jgi:hypothetical protein
LIESDGGPCCRPIGRSQWAGRIVGLDEQVLRNGTGPKYPNREYPEDQATIAAKPKYPATLEHLALEASRG